MRRFVISAFVLTACLLAAGSSPLWGSCTLSAVDPSTTICTPANGATVTAPIHVVAGATDSQSMRALQIYLDGVKVYEIAANSLDTNVNATDGTHRLTVQGIDAA